MDEPTSAISEKECQHLFRLVGRLKKRGIAFVFITHKMDEVFQISDEITIMRDGTYVGTYDAEKITHDELVKLMVGREITEMFPKEEAEITDVKLEVRGMNVGGLLQDINFKVHKGEILGFAGLMGAGRTEVMETLFGIRRASSGTIKIDGKEVRISSPKDAIKYKIAFLTEDRRTTGCFLPLSVRDNIMVCSYDQISNKIKKISVKKEKEVCARQIEQYAIKTPDEEQVIGNLSGGNQQKALISRWQLTDPEIIILDEPTRGIIPIPVIILAALSVFTWYLLKYTRLGRHIYAIGGNAQAAVVSGVNVKAVKLFTYIYAGIMAAIAGMLLTARVASGQPGLGESFEMKANSGCVIGGVSLNGGIGSVYSLICGILIIGVLNNGMDLMNINGYMQQIAEGLILILAVLLDVFRSRTSK